MIGLLLALALPCAAPGPLLADEAGELARAARELRRQGAPERALAALDAAPPALADDARLVGERIQALLDADRIGDALVAHAATAALTQGPAPLVVARLRLMILQGHPDAALAGAESALATLPEHADLQAARIDALCALGEPERAQAALQALPAELPAALRTRLFVDVLRARARELSGSPELLERAVGLLEEARALQPDRLDVRLELVVALASWGRLERAESLAREALDASAEATRSDVLYALGFVHGSGLRDDEAAACFEQVLASTPGHARAAVELARCRTRAGDLAAARELLHESLQLAPENAEALFALAEINLEQRAPEPATELLERILQRNPRNVKALWLMSRALAMQGRHEEQQAVLRRWEERRGALAAR